LDAAVDLCAELAVVHKLKERVLLGRSEEPRTARGILPQDNDLTLEPFKRGCSLQSRIGGASFARCSGIELRFKKHNYQVRAPDIQISDRNRTI